MVKGPNIYTINSSSFTTREQAYLRSQPFCLHTNVVCCISLRWKTVVLSSTTPLGCRNSTWADGTGDAKLHLAYTRCWAMGSHEAPMHHSGDGRIQPWFGLSAWVRNSISWGQSWGSLTPRHPDAAGNHTELGTEEVGYSSSSMIFLCLAEIVWEGRGAFCRRCKQHSSVNKGFLHDPNSSSWWKRILIHTVYWLFIMENGCIPPPQSGPEIKYVLQERMSGKGSLLAKLWGAI